jgi:hypothetical protein
MQFKLLVDADVIDILSRFPARKRHRFYAHFRRIQRYPGNYSDHTEPDTAGRRLNVSVFEGQDIRYWIDVADRHVKILEIEANE